MSIYLLVDVIRTILPNALFFDIQIINFGVSYFWKILEKSVWSAGKNDLNTKSCTHENF